MLKKFKATTIAATVALSTLAAGSAQAETYEYSRYTGWEVWAYINDSGILDKWNAKYSEDVAIEYVGDYVESLNNFKNGNSMGVTATNMDALIFFASAGVKAEGLINGDYSNGNDGIVLRDGNSCADLEGRTVLLMEETVSDYLMIQCLASAGLTRDDVQTENTSDGDIANLFNQDSSVKAVVTWNPPLQLIKTNHEANVIYTSKQRPFEILDTMYVNPNAPETEKKVLVGAWFEALDHIKKRGSKRSKAIKFMAKNSGATPAQFKAQLSTTKFLTADEQIAFAKSDKINDVMTSVRGVVIEHFIPKKSMAKNLNIQFQNGTVIGDKTKVNITYPTDLIEQAAAGKL